MSDLSTFEDVDAYAREHGGVDGLRMMLNQSTLAGRRKEIVESFLRHHDAEAQLAVERERANEREAQAKRSVDAAERSAAASERSAFATEVASVASQRSARYAMYAAIISLVAIIVTVVHDFYR